MEFLRGRMCGGSWPEVRDLDHDFKEQREV